MISLLSLSLSLSDYWPPSRYLATHSDTLTISHIALAHSDSLYDSRHVTAPTLNYSLAYGNKLARLLAKCSLEDLVGTLQMVYAPAHTKFIPVGLT